MMSIDVLTEKEVADLDIRYYTSSTNYCLILLCDKIKKTN